MWSNRPIIGVTGPHRGGTGAWIFTALSIWLAGGRPKRITTENSVAQEDIDGLIIGGGADIEPVRYGAEWSGETSTDKPKRTLTERLISLLFYPLVWLTRFLQHKKDLQFDEQRDEMELRLIDQTLHEGKPVLGICRGMQLLNVYFGGNLHQEISSFYSEGKRISTVLPKKWIVLESESQLSEILGTQRSLVNALHHQSVAELGEGLLVAAREEETNIIQGIEHPDYPFVTGVQWHPEYMIQIRRQRRIFKTLVASAASNL
jgi:putative glutamine amidotransferase